MLSKIIGNVLVGMTKCHNVIDFVEPSEKSSFGRLLNKVKRILYVILCPIYKIVYFSLMVSLTGGLYLVWVGFKLIRSRNKSKHNKTKSRKRA